MGEVVMDGETETLAGVVWLRQRAGQLAWVRAEAEGPRSPRQLVALGVDLVAEEVRNLLPDSVDVAGPTPTAKDEVGLLRSAEKLHTVTGVRAAGDAAADLVGEANTGAGPDRRRTPGERLAPNDELARLMLLEVSGERSPAMLRVSRLLDERTEDQTLQLADAETPAGQKAR